MLTTFTEPQADAASVLDKLFAESPPEVAVITSRYVDQAAFARRWLSGHALPIRVAHASRAPKTEICPVLGVDVLLDDDINQLATRTARYCSTSARCRCSTSYRTTVNKRALKGCAARSLAFASQVDESARA